MHVVFQVFHPLYKYNYMYVRPSIDETTNVCEQMKNVKGLMISREARAEFQIQ